MEQRAKEMGKMAEAAVYRKYIEQMKKKTKEMQKEAAPNTADAMKRYKAGKAGFTDKAHLKAKGLIPRADGTKERVLSMKMPQQMLQAQQFHWFWR